jgi:hypothetical protein
MVDPRLDGLSVRLREKRELGGLLDYLVRLRHAYQALRTSMQVD